MATFSEVKPHINFIYRLTPEQVSMTCLSNEHISSEGQFYLDGQFWESALHCYYYTKFPDSPSLTVEEIKAKLKHEKSKLWNSIKIPIMRRILFSKFEQNIQYFKVLMDLCDSAINSIDEVYDGISVKEILFYIREYYIKNGHPLIAPKNSKMSQTVAQKYKDWKSGTGWKKRTV